MHAGRKFPVFAHIESWKATISTCLSSSYRCIGAEHVGNFPLPMFNLEPVQPAVVPCRLGPVMLSLGRTAIYPLSIFCARLLYISDDKRKMNNVTCVTKK